MNEPAMRSVPREARSYQGTSAGVVTRLAAGIVDVVLAALALAGSYVALVGARFVLEPRSFHMPDPSFLWSMTVFLGYLVVYLAVAWWMAGRTIGDHLWGVRVTTRGGGRLGPARALVRAGTCAVFPIGLLWCAIDRDRRSVQDLLLRTSVVYDWTTHPSAPLGEGGVL